MNEEKNALNFVETDFLKKFFPNYTYSLLKKKKHLLHAV